MEWKAKKGWWLALLLVPLVWVKKKTQKIKPKGAFFSTVGPGGVTGYVWLRASAAWECGTSSDGAQTGTDRDGEREAAVMTGRREKPRGLTKSKEKLISAESFLLSLSLKCVKNLKKKKKSFKGFFCPYT